MNIINFEILNKDSLQCSSFLGNNLFIGGSMHMHEVNAAVLIGSRHLYGYEEIYLHQVLLFIKLMEPAFFPILTSLLVGSSFLSMESSESICLGVPL